MLHTARYVNYSHTPSPNLRADTEKALENDGLRTGRVTGYAALVKERAEWREMNARLEEPVS